MSLSAKITQQNPENIPTGDETSRIDRWPWLLAIAAALPGLFIWAFAWFLDNGFRQLAPRNYDLAQTYKGFVVFSGIALVRYGGWFALALAIAAIQWRKERISSLSVLLCGFGLSILIISMDIRFDVLAYLYRLKR